MNNCLYTNKPCDHADESGECKQGVQNCGWENWDYTDIDELDLFDMLDEEEEL